MTIPFAGGERPAHTNATGLTGEGAEQTEIVDAHTNLCYPGETHGGSRWNTFGARVAVLREAGISHALACRNEPVAGRSYHEMAEWNSRIASACEASRGLYFPAAIVRPDLAEACDLLRECREEFGMCFVGELRDRGFGYQWGTSRYYRLLERAIGLRMVPLIHCENQVAAEIGQRYPEGRFLIAHLCSSRARWPEDRIAVLASYPSLYLEISGADMYQEGILRKAAAGLGATRIVFGSDLGAFDPLLAVACVKRSGLTETEQALAFAGNFRVLCEWTQRREVVRPLAQGAASRCW